MIGTKQITHGGYISLPKDFKASEMTFCMLVVFDFIERALPVSPSRDTFTATFIAC